MASRLQTSNGYLTDILANTNDIESYLAAENNGVNDTDVEILLNSIKTTQTSTATNIADCETYLNQIKGQVTTIRSLLGTLNINDPDQMTIIDAVNYIAASQTLLETKLDTISGQLTTMSSMLSTISTTLTNLLSTVQNIDNLIDTISWSSISNNNIGWSTSNTGEYNYSTNTRPFENNNIIYFDTKITQNANNMNGMLKIILPYAVTASNYDFISKSVIDIISSNGNSVQNCDYFIKLGFASIEIYLYNIVALPYNSSYSLNLRITLSETTRNIYKYTNSASVSYIPNTDIEYWQLLSYFQQIKQYSTVNAFDQSLYSKLNEILTAINNLNLSVNVSDQDVQDVTNDFDTDIDTIHNIENDYGLNFDGWDDQLSSSDVTLDLTGYSDTVNLFKTNITSLWSSPLVSLPILFSCICFIFLVILG